MFHRKTADAAGRAKGQADRTGRTDSGSADSGRVDWGRIARWTDEVLAGKPRDIRKLFEGRTGASVEMIWDPAGDGLPPVLGFLLEHWQALAAEASPPPAARIDPFALRPALGYILQFDVVDDGRDFRCRLYGSAVASVSGFEMTGKLLSEFPGSHYVAEYALAQSRAVWRRARPLYSRRRPAQADFVTSWHRLTLPFADAAGNVTRLMIGSLPTDAAGEIANI